MSTFQKCRQHRGDSLDTESYKSGRSKSQDNKSNFSVEFEIANEDWNESKLDNAKMENYNNADCLKKISKLQKLLCMCKLTCDSFCTRLSPREQHRIVRDIFKRDYLVAGSKRFILSAVWWRKWCDYVNYSEDSNINLEESFITFSFYEKPPTIQN